MGVIHIPLFTQDTRPTGGGSKRAVLGPMGSVQLKGSDRYVLVSCDSCAT